MKTLQESLFDKDLVQKEYKINPTTLGYKWEYRSILNASLTDFNVIYKFFDKDYIKKCKPTEEQIDDHLERTYGIRVQKFPYIRKDADMLIKKLKIGRVIETWSNTLDSDDFPQGYDPEVHSNIDNQNILPGIKPEKYRDMFVTARRKVVNGENELLIEIHTRTNNKWRNVVIFKFINRN